ncbi:MAG TPA: hypothetical protein VKB69_08080 [Micromonosporaceae bacterium]|nr:hypothetical protein [Micromonosporaceae bacterium]
MDLFGKGGPPVRAIALVASAEAPPQGLPSFGRQAQGVVRVVVDGRQLTTTARYSDKHWLVRGMDVPVLLDPARPGTFEVDWDAIPDMRSRAAANDPALADPIAAAQRVARALGIPFEHLRGTPPERLREALERAAATPAPPGRVRAVVLVATVRGHRAGSDDRGDDVGLTLHRASEAVLAVNVPGRAPYAVFDPGFKVPRGQGFLGGCLPALVSAADPKQVEILWSEAPTLAETVATRVAEAQRRADDQTAALGDQIRAATQQAMQGVAGGPAVQAQMREVIVNNLRASLRYVTDPAHRQMMIDQYRAIGIEITPDELGL